MRLFISITFKVEINYYILLALTTRNTRTPGVKLLVVAIVDAVEPIFELTILTSSEIS